MVEALSERVARGWAIEGVEIIHCNDSLIKLSCTTNESRFREGDLILLHRGNPQDSEALHLELEYDGETKLEASLIDGNHHYLSTDPYGWIIDQDILDLSHFYKDALNVVADSLRGRSIILLLLQGSLFSKLDYARYEHALQILSETQLNNNQVEAVAQAYARNAPRILFADVYPKSGAGTNLLLYETAANAFVATVSGAHLEGVGATDRMLPNCNGEEVSLVAEVGRLADARGFDLHGANDLAVKLLAFYEPVFSHKDGHVGRWFDAVYDVDTIQPTDEWRQVYADVREKLVQLGVI